MYLPLPKLPAPGRVRLPHFHMPRISAKIRPRITFRGKRIVAYMEKWKNTFLRRSGAALRAWIIKSFKVVKNRKRHSGIGSQPLLHLPKSQFIKGAVQFHVSYPQENVIVGTAYSRSGIWGGKHEHGKKVGITQYPPRPFVGPQGRRWWKYGRPAIEKDMAVKIKSELGY